MRAEPATAERYCLFDAAIGPCGAAWSAHGLTRVQLPEADPGATLRRLRRGSAQPDTSKPPPAVEQAISRIKRYLAGEEVDFVGVALDLTGVSAFHRNVYDAARRIGWGQTATYGELARQAGAPGAARAVGQALGRNPIPIIIPCHRILAAGGKVGGFSAFGGPSTKQRLLALEGLGAGDLPLLPACCRHGVSATKPALTPNPTPGPRSVRAQGGAYRRGGSAGGRT